MAAEIELIVDADRSVRHNDHEVLDLAAEFHQPTEPATGSGVCDSVP